MKCKVITVISNADSPTTVNSTWKDTVGDAQHIVAPGQGGGRVGLLDDAIELAKRGQRSRTHPHNEVLVDEAVVVGIRRVQLVNGLPPVHRFGRA